jgi:predicted acylesterase/phospholipase RssA
MSFRPRNLVFSGGGLKGIVFVGVVQKLEETNVISGARCFLGTSAGSIVAFMLSIGYTSSEMHVFAMGLRQADVFDVSLEGILSIMDTYGIDDGHTLQRTLGDILEKKGLHRCTTFTELSKAMGRTLTVAVSSLNVGVKYLSVDTTPNMRVVDAVYASCCIPMLFTPLVLDGEYLVDGFLYKNFAPDYFKSGMDTLGFELIDPPGSRKIKSFVEYVGAIIGTTMDYSNAFHKGDVTDHNICRIVMNHSAPSVIDDVPQEMKETLVKKGYDAVTEYFKTRP